MGEVEITKEHFEALSVLGLVIDGSSGGLILGALHKDNGIKVIKAYECGRYVIFAEVEGWEYLINSFATISHKEELLKINTTSAKDIEPYEFEDTILTIDCRDKYFPGEMIRPIIMINECQRIINRNATKLNLHRLNQINLISNPNEAN